MGFTKEVQEFREGTKSVVPLPALRNMLMSAFATGYITCFMKSRIFPPDETKELEQMAEFTRDVATNIIEQYEAYVKELEGKK